MPKAEDDSIFEYPRGIPLSPEHPGRTLAAELSARGLSANALALKLRVPANLLSEIIRGPRGIAAKTALQLGRRFGADAAFCMNLQDQCDLALAERERGERVSREVATT